MERELSKRWPPTLRTTRPWERGDLLVWDQRRVFHGRVPYELRDDDPRLMCAPLTVGAAMMPSRLTFGCRSARRWRIDFERDPRDELNYLPQNEAPPRAAL